MKAVEELRAEFEETEIFKGYDNFVIYVHSVNDYRSDRYSDYSMGFLSGAWFMFQELKK